MNQTNVPLRTSLFFQLGIKDGTGDDVVLAESVSITLQGEGEPPQVVLSEGKEFAEGFEGAISPSQKPKGALAVNVECHRPLKPLTRYTIRVEAKTRDGNVLEASNSLWQFTTADTPKSHQVDFAADLGSPPIQWRGGFFTGFCKPSFCTSASNRIAGYELMSEIRESLPGAWSLQRDFTLTGMLQQPRFLDPAWPNVVRERETRRITLMETEETEETEAILHVTDFFGHEQYGIESGRALAADYQPDHVVLVADGISHAKATVVKVVSDSPDQKTLRVRWIDPPPEQWKLEYARPLPTKEDPNAPGLFPFGGCYLRKFLPSGTPAYYWERVDKEWDIACRQFDRRLVVNFTDAPGDLSVDGQPWTFPKDYVQYHQVVQDITSHVIERYGDDSQDFYWSVFNEPDLAALFWRSRDWDEAQKFYDYTVDAILRSFEDHGYDSQQVMVGGIEIGAIFGTAIERPLLKKLLCHCSPTAECEGALRLNQAFADRRLDGRRSKRVESLCEAHEGCGSPCDFVSIHGYNNSKLLADKLIRGKRLALEIDPQYFAELRINAFETCPDWAPPPTMRQPTVI